VDYIDLFSGPGSYGDGTASTPLLILRAAIHDPKLCTSLRTYFNDSDQSKAKCLQSEFDRLTGLEKLVNKPRVFNEEASIAFVEGLHLDPKTPKLFFLDPFGYKPLTMPLLRSALAGWAECIFFFNYRRVIGAINNPAFHEHVERLFGASRLAELKQEIAKSGKVLQRESIVMKHLNSALNEAGAKYLMQFAFKVEDEQRSKHYLIFATRHRKGFEAMKTIMARESTHVNEEGPSMTFTERPSEPTLFDRDPHEVLADNLIGRFQSRAISLDEIYEEIGLETTFTQPYFRRALLLLEQRGQVRADPPASSRPVSNGKLSMSGSTVIIFPGKTS
jgi:three-Cys-motif partner protein